MTKVTGSCDEYPRGSILIQLCLYRRKLSAGNMNEILCTTDFSDSSKEALKWSVSFAKKLKSPLTILYTYRLLKRNGEGAALKKIMEEGAAKKFAELENEILKSSGIAYQCKTEVGFIDDRIEQHMKANKVSFLVMGNDMRKSITESFDELMSEVHVPLVIVP
jgi:nucleotide-binding universal stress UspA family protein